MLRVDFFAPASTHAAKMGMSDQIDGETSMTKAPLPWIMMTGTTRGLGRALAQQLRAGGFAVCALARAESLMSCADSADRSLTWDCARPWNQNESTELLKFCRENHVAGFIHVAGLLGPMVSTPMPSDSEEWTRWWADYHAAVAVNFTGGSELVHALQPLLKGYSSSMQGQCPPFVMHLSSGAAVKPYAGWNAYCASKAAMLMEFKCLAAQHSSKELLVLSVAPGTVMTDMMRQVLSAQPDDFPAIGKFKELEKTGGLVSPESAAHKIFSWLTESPLQELGRWHGELYDVRNKS